MAKKGRRGLPPMEDMGGRGLIGPTPTGYTVCSWCPDQHAKMPPTAVAIVIAMRLADTPMDMVLRLKSPQRVDEMIQALLRHKRDVWPDAP